jgi:hypothetical protein
MHHRHWVWRNRGKNLNYAKRLAKHDGKVNWNLSQNQRQTTINGAFGEIDNVIVNRAILGVLVVFSVLR